MEALRRRNSRLRPSNRESNERRRQGGLEHSRRRSRRVETANHGRRGRAGTGHRARYYSEGVRSAPRASLNFFCFWGALPFSSFARACASKTPTTSSSWARKVAYTSGACFG